MPSGGLWRPSLETTLGHPEKTPKRTPFVNKSMPSIACGIARGNAGFASIRIHSPISLTLPLSSFGWLRNNSSSHRRSASFRNSSDYVAHPTTNSHLRRSATEAQLGLELEVELKFSGVRSRVRVRVQIAEVDLPSPDRGSDYSLNPNCRVSVRDRIRV